MDKLPIMPATVDLTESAQDPDDSANVFSHSHSLSVEPVNPEPPPRELKRNSELIDDLKILQKLRREFLERESKTLSKRIITQEIAHKNEEKKEKPQASFLGVRAFRTAVLQAVMSEPSINRKRERTSDVEPKRDQGVFE